MKLNLTTLLIGFLILTNNLFGQTEVGGTICYPSYYIPEMTIYLKNIDSNSLYKTTVQKNQKTFKFADIPKGKYVVYAYTKDEIMSDEQGNKFKGSGGFTQMVPCGLSVDCIDHTLIEFEVKSNKKINNLEICDWYGAIVPLEN